jgi:hypothetical protein
VNIKEAVSRALTRRAASTGEGVTSRTVAELERHAGGHAAAAREAGVSPETWRRWRNGTQTPSRRRREGLEAAVRRARLRPGRERRLRESRPAITLTATVRVSSDTRERTIDLGAYAEPGYMGELIDAYLDGNEDRQTELIEGLLDSYVPGMEIEDASSLHVGAAGAYGDEQ